MKCRKCGDRCHKRMTGSAKFNPNQIATLVRNLVYAALE
jgi:hypothetical protein